MQNKIIIKSPFENLFSVYPTNVCDTFMLTLYFIRTIYFSWDSFFYSTTVVFFGNFGISFFFFEFNPGMEISTNTIHTTSRTACSERARLPICNISEGCDGYPYLYKQADTLWFIRYRYNWWIHFFVSSYHGWYHARRYWLESWGNFQKIQVRFQRVFLGARSCLYSSLDPLRMCRAFSKIMEFQNSSFIVDCVKPRDIYFHFVWWIFHVETSLSLAFRSLIDFPSLYSILLLQRMAYSLAQKLACIIDSRGNDKCTNIINANFFFCCYIDIVTPLAVPVIPLRDGVTKTRIYYILPFSSYYYYFCFQVDLVVSGWK